MIGLIKGFSISFGSVMGIYAGVKFIRYLEKKKTIEEKK